MLRDADTAMYRAKQRNSREGFAIFDEQMHRHALRRLKLETDLRQSLESGDASIHQHYQPIVNLRTGHVESFECLMRWTHPEHGAVPPIQFIPVAEEIGLIDRLSLALVRRACAHLSEWKAAGIDSLRLNINIAAFQLLHGDLSGDLNGLLEEFDLTPSQIILELTESALITAVESTGSQLESLFQSGYRMAIDDFGTGYSSLAYLRTLPVASLKLDQSFVQELGRDPNARAIVESVIAMTRNLNIKVTAEGVETRSQLEELRKLGCDLGQGYYFSRPLAASSVPQFLKSNPVW
jgi:EAL domain-containing protein (putative c-di-GMP-specific phosphodiesterase class I)